MYVDYYKNNHNKIELNMENSQDDNEDEEDYIDMEVKSFTNVFPKKPENSLEFEFHKSTSLLTNVERDHSTASPADELFYKGKLLPLHLPPRLEMVEKLLLDSPLSSSKFDWFTEKYDTPLGTNAATTPMNVTPFESCSVSPVESCRVSRELCPKKSNAATTPATVNSRELCPKKASWAKKLRTKIKSFFVKSEGSTIDNLNDDSPHKLKEEIVCHRRSFSSAFKRRSSMTKVSSSYYSSVIVSSSSLTLSAETRPAALKRSNSADSEIETSLIQGAIAHCKQSQQTFEQSKKNLSEVVINCHSFPSRFVAFDDQDGVTKLCRG